ncbi:MAG: Gfo/Idh/MocA family protein, partial [Flavisolibacter sp.]
MPGRRQFLKHTSKVVIGSAFLSVLDHSAFAVLKKRLAPSDQVNIGAIGINGMGWANVLSALKLSGVNLVAVCDVDKNVIDRRLSELARLNIDSSKVKIFSDYRELLDQKDVDAVIIGTPDHWHALIMIDACGSGKDVYVEKPVGNSIIECRAMVAVQKEHNRVVQAGQW